MTYHVPSVPDGGRVDVDIALAYLLEDGFEAAPADALRQKLALGRPLRVKFGVDPTAPAVTWGWSVPLRRLRRWQELGHTAVLVVGDFTAQIGDPSLRSSTRIRLTQPQVDAYVDACMASLLEILSPEHLEVRRNSEWLSTLDMAGVLELTSQATVAQLLERDDFRKRFTAHEPISLIEFMYPLLQGMDSIAVEADVELGGSDQYFNLMLARVLQQRAGQVPQALLCGPLLVGTDGERKMSQSIGNYIGVGEPPKELFGKVMSIPDETMPDYVNLALDLRPEEKKRALDDLSGVKLKRWLAREMIAMFHGADAAQTAEHEFDEVFVRHAMPTELDEHTSMQTYLPRLLQDIGFTASLNEARRGIRGGGVRVDGEVVSDEHASLDAGTYVVQLGRRRFARVTVDPSAAGPTAT